MIYSILLITTLFAQIPTIISHSIPSSTLNHSDKSSIIQVDKTTKSSQGSIHDQSSTIVPADNIDSIEEEIKNEVFVNDLLEKPNEPAVVIVPELHQGPEYDLDWTFIDKDTIRVTFDIYSLPKSLIEVNKHSESTENKESLLATMMTMPSKAVKSIFSLEYFLFIIRPYASNKEIIMKMEKLHVKETNSSKFGFYSNSLRLTALNPKEKYSICICYYRTNTSTEAPDLLLCQDIINDYGKFSDLRTDPRHGLVFITTQYSIIIALLAFLQGTYTIRKRRFAQVIRQHLANKAHSIRTTLSSVSLVRQSFSSLDAAEQQQQQQHTTNGQTIQHEPTIVEEETSNGKSTFLPSPAIVISDSTSTNQYGAQSSDENEPFLRRIPSKNHVHFLLGPGEGSEDDNTDDEHEHIPMSSNEPYQDQSDALLSMAHILDTNKPWSRHDHDSSMA